MKKILLTVALSTLYLISYSQQAWDKVFFTEYLEGSGTQRAVEIGNNSGTAISLNRLRINTYFNGSTTPGATYQLVSAEDGTTTLSQRNVFVLFKQSTTSPYLDASAMPGTNASNRFGTTSGVINYTGNDAIELQYDTDGNQTWVTIDVIGKIGVNPTNGYWSATGLKTIDMSISRKSTVVKGTQSITTSFPLLSEWNANYDRTIPASGIFPTLGKHSFSIPYNITAQITPTVGTPSWTGGYHYDYQSNVLSNTLDNVTTQAELSIYRGSKDHKLGNTKGYFTTVTNSATGRKSLVDPDGYEFISIGLNAVDYSSPTTDIRNLPEDLFNININTLGAWSSIGNINKDPNPKIPFTYILNLLRDYQIAIPTNATPAERADIEAKNARITALMDKDIFPIFSTSDRQNFVTYCTSDLQKSIGPSLVTNKFLIGYFSDNEIRAYNPNSLSKYLNVNNYTQLGANDPTYLYAKNWYAARYPNTTPPVTPLTADNVAWHVEFAKVYYGTVNSLIKARDPNHLYLGSRFTNMEKNEWPLFNEAGNHLDIITVNYYLKWTPDLVGDVDRWASESGKPVMITECGAKAMDVPNRDDLAQTATFNVSTQEDRAYFLENYVMGLLKSKNFVGFHWFQYADPAVNQNKGLVDVNHNWYVPLKNSFEKIGKDIYNLRNWLQGEQLAQHINFAPIPQKDVNDPNFTLSATASTNLPVTYTSSNTSVAVIVNNNQVNIVGPGKTTITATQNGNQDYAATSTIQELLVRSGQTITFNAIADKFLLESDFATGATASSGLPITYSSSDPAVATIVNNKVHLVGPGTVTITASQAGDEIYEEATSVARSFTVTNTIQLSPTDDAYVRDGSSNTTNFGSSNLLLTKNDSNPGYYREAFLKFNLNSLVGGNITSAELKMTVSNSSALSTLYAFPTQTDSWSENTITYNNKPAYLSTSVGSASSSGFVMDLKAFVVQEVAGDKTASFCIKNKDYNSDIVVDFYSKEELLASRRPVLEVTVSKDEGTQNLSSIAEKFKIDHNTIDRGIKDNVSIFPNPSSTVIKIEVSEEFKDAKIILYDTNGNLKLSRTISGTSADVDVSGLTSGIYLIKVNGPFSSVTKKIIKE